MNETIRTAARQSRVPLWKVAAALHVSEATFTRMMRRELPKDKQEQILSIIAKEASNG